MKSIIKLGVLAAAAALTLSACGSSASSSTPSAGAGSSHSSSPSSSSSGTGSGGSNSASAMITIKGFAFKSPASVPAGAKVTVTNKDATAHTVTSDKGGLFDIKVNPGTSVTFTAPSKAGSYPFHCMFHSNMHGMLKVG